MASQIASLTIVYSTVYSGTDQRKHQSSASLAFVRGIHRLPCSELPAQRDCNAENVPIDDVIMLPFLTDQCGLFTHMHQFFHWGPFD